MLIIFLICVSSSVLFSDSRLYKINALNSTDTVFSNFLKDIIRAKKYEKIPAGISIKHLNNHSNLPKFKIALYKMKDSDNIVNIAKSMYINPETLISLNKFTHFSQIKKDVLLLIPNMKGVLHTVEKDTSVFDIAELYDIPPVTIVYVNELSQTDLYKGEDIFVPGGTISDIAVEDFLGRVFLLPLEETIVTSPYGIRKDPFSGEKQMHYGIDYRAKTGTPVYAAQYGTVTEAGYHGNYGKLVVIKHKDNYKTYYGHLESYEVSEGDFVQTGDIIAKSGNTGRSTGPHLHFEIRYDNTPINPESLDNFGQDKPTFISYMETQRNLE